MSFLHTNYDKPGPGVAPDTPRKVGLGRLAEVLARDVFSFWKAGGLLLVSVLPATFCIGVACSSGSVLLLLLGGALGGVVAGPQICGLMDTILRSLRDEPGFWWHTYRQAWRRNASACLLPGAVTGLLLGMQLFVLSNLDKLTVTASFAAVLTVGSLLAVGLALLVWVQLALFSLPISNILRNSLLLFLLSPARTAGAILVQVAYWGCLWLFVPTSLSVLPLTGIWFPFLVSVFLLYQPLEKSFDLEASIHAVQEERYHPAE